MRIVIFHIFPKYTCTGSKIIAIPNKAKTAFQLFRQQELQRLHRLRIDFPAHGLKIGDPGLIVCQLGKTGYRGISLVSHQYDYGQSGDDSSDDFRADIGLTFRF